MDKKYLSLFSSWYKLKEKIAAASYGDIDANFLELIQMIPKIKQNTIVEILENGNISNKYANYIIDTMQPNENFSFLHNDNQVNSLIVKDGIIYRNTIAGVSLKELGSNIFGIKKMEDQKLLNVNKIYFDNAQIGEINLYVGHAVDIYGTISGGVDDYYSINTYGTTKLIFHDPQILLTPFVDCDVEGVFVIPLNFIFPTSIGFASQNQNYYSNLTLKIKSPIYSNFSSNFLKNKNKKIYVPNIDYKISNNNEEGDWKNSFEDYQQILNGFTVDYWSWGEGETDEEKENDMIKELLSASYGYNRRITKIKKNGKIYTLTGNNRLNIELDSEGDENEQS